MQLVRELKGAELTFIALIMLMGEEGVDYAFYGRNDDYPDDWWAARLYTRRN